MIPAISIKSKRITGTFLLVLLLIVSGFLVCASITFALLQQKNMTAKGEIQVRLTVQVRKNHEVIEYKVENIPGSYAGLGKSPHWSSDTLSVYYVDFDGRLLRFDYCKNIVFSCKLEHEGMPIFMIPIRGTTDRFAVGIQRRVLEVSWDGHSSRCNIQSIIFELETEPQFKDHRINVGKCDSRGRLFVGTMLSAGDEFAHKKGTLYKYENGKVELMLSNIGISNGMAFNDDLKKFYFIDTAAYNLREFDYDIENGVLAKSTVIMDLHNTDTREHLKLPDGMTIDKDGNLYITFFNTGTIYKFNPSTRKILMEIKVPAKELSSAGFGGPHYDILYVGTGARFDEPLPAGYLFKITELGAKGLQEPSFLLQNQSKKRLQSPIRMSEVGEETQVKMTVEVRKGNEVVEYKVRAVPGSYAGLGKSPHWVNETQNVYYVDFDLRLLRYDYSKNEVHSCKLEHEGMPVFMIPIEGTTDRFAVGIQRRVLEVSWDGQSAVCKIERTIFELETEPQFKDHRINVGKCDSRGRLFVGTMLSAGDEFAHKKGTLYKYENGKVEPLLSEIGISNGMAFNDDLKKFYFIDTAAYNLREFDYDVEKGVISNPVVIMDLHNTETKEHLKLPDGMTIDKDGNLYITFFNTGTIYKFDPRTRQILLEIKVPVKELSSAGFGGPQYDILYVGTGARFDEPKPAGYLFQVTGLGVKGLPEPKMRI